MITYRYFFLIIILLGNILIPSDFAFQDIPVQENGRIKPLDTFARNQLLSIYSKRSLKTPAFPDIIGSKKMSAIDWFYDIATHPNDADKYRVFNIRNPEVVGSLGLKWDINHLYNRNEILNGLQNQLDYITKLQTLQEEDLTSFDQQMLHIYTNVIHFQELCYSFTCILDLIDINDTTIAQILNVKPGSKISYYYVMQNANALNKLIEGVASKDIADWSKADTATSILLNTIHELNQDKFAQRLRIMPPDDLSLDAMWLAPWTVMDGRQLSSNQERILNVLSDYLNSRLIGDDLKEDRILSEYEAALLPFSTIINMDNLKTERWYNSVDLFVKSIILYILAFLVLAISWMNQNVHVRRISYLSLLCGLGFHLYGIILRIIIMQRPPISTLYESIIFVSVIGVICATILEYNRQDGTGIFAGSICGIVLHFVGFGYANDGDTLGMLVAVLNSNFWLATHVTTITTGYGTSLFAGLLGHIYLLQAIRYPNDKKYLKTIGSNVYGATLFALFFTMFGTILGGIWADQSWGRFWGWDPKENGALLIVMWQIMMLHFRITGFVKPLGFALGMVLNNIIVVLAWFGVNLLSVGLHSYGFAEGIARNLVIFILAELIIGIGTYYWAKSRQ